MPIPHFTILAHNCWCSACFKSAHEELGYEAGVVCGHLHHRQGWQCVYCGGPVFRHTHMLASLCQSISSWVGWCLWELRVARSFRIRRFPRVRVGK
jgi:hypothetical protein